MINQAEVVRAMSHRNFYPQKTSRVETMQTHISHIFVCDNEVYKVKKPVDFGFLHFASLEERRFFCEQEVLLNRRLAPRIYDGVVAITREKDGVLAINGPGEAVEYAVKMKRIPAGNMLKNLLDQGMANEKTIENVARRLAEFHKIAATSAEISEMGKVATISFNWEENFTQVEPFVDLTIPLLPYRFIPSYIRDFLGKNQDLLEERVARGSIRDCHGDLHLEHIVCDGEEISVFDCIEFNERFRYGDITTDVAFLSMDLDFNGYRELSRHFVDAYVRHSGDAKIASLLNFYKCYYAFVRGKVNSFRLNEKKLPIDARISTAKLAGGYFDLALRYATEPRKPTVIIVCGFMGVGKSQMTRSLAALLGIEAVVMDALRKKMLNIPVNERHYDGFSKGIYSEEVTTRVYAKALDLAREKLSLGASLIIDASFKKREMREQARQLAAELGADFIAIRCHCPDSVIEERLKRRARRTGGTSDGRWEIYAEQKRSTDDFDHLAPQEFFSVDTSGDKQESLFTALVEMRKRLE